MNQWMIFYLLWVPVVIWAIKPEWPAWLRLLRLVAATVGCYVLIHFTYATARGIEIAKLRPETMYWAVAVWWYAAIVYAGLWNAAWEWFMRATGRSPEPHALNYFSGLLVVAALVILLYSLIQRFLFRDFTMIMPLALPGLS